MAPVIVREWCERWQSVFDRASLGTLTHNEQMVRGFVAKHGSLELREVTALQAQEWGGRKPGTVRYVKLLFADAVRAGLLECSPFDRVSVSRGPGRSKVEPPTEQMVLGLAEKASGLHGEWGQVFGRAVLFSAYTGLRLGEMAAVEARDVQLVPAPMVFVRRPKRPAPERTVGIFGPAVGVVTEQTEVGLLFTSRTGRALRRDMVSRAWGELCRSAGVSFEWHQLRHFCATWLLDHGASAEDVALQLGHQDGGLLVRRTYGHPSTMLAVERLRRAVG